MVHHAVHIGRVEEEEQAKQQAVRAVEQPRTPSNVGEDYKSSANSRLKEHGRAYRWHPWGKSGRTAIGRRAGPQQGHPLGKRASQTAGGLGVPSTLSTLGVPGERGHKMTRCARHLIKTRSSQGTEASKEHRQTAGVLTSTAGSGVRGTLSTLAELQYRPAVLLCVVAFQVR